MKKDESVFREVAIAFLCVIPLIVAVAIIALTILWIARVATLSVLWKTIICSVIALAGTYLSVCAILAITNKIDGGGCRADD